MLRSFLGRKWVLATLAIGTVLAFSATVVPALGGPSLKQLVKKEVARQLKGKTGPQGPPGTPGANGSTSPSAASFVNNSGLTSGIDATDETFLTTQITLTASSLLQATSMMHMTSTSGTPVVDCWIKVDGTDISTRSGDTVSGEVTTTVVGAANNVSAGLHTVTAGCVEPGAGAADYNGGNLNVIAVG
jgi:hypothetical protein